MDVTQSAYEKIDALNIEAWNVRVSDSTKANILSGEAVKLSNEIDYNKGKAEGLRTLGFSFIRISKHTEALQYLEESLRLFESLNDLKGQSDVYEYFGIIKRSFGDYKSSLETLYKALELRRQTDYKEGEALSLYHLGVTYRYLGNLEQALDFFLKSLSLSKEQNFWISESYSLNNIGSIYLELNDHENALKYYQQSLEIRKKAGDKWGEAGCLDNIGLIYYKSGEYEKALKYTEQSLEIARSVNDKKGQSNSLLHLAEINYLLKKFPKALECVNQSLEIRREIGDKKGQAEAYLSLAEIEIPANGIADVTKRQFDYLNYALALGEETSAVDLLYKIHNKFYKSYKELKQYDKALEHFESFNELEKEIHSNSINQKIVNLEITHRVEKSLQEAEIYRLRNIELANMYEESNNQKEKIELQKTDLEKTLEELKAAQYQLVQREKMASLGELTAGIAHEIQNPLNFVNNFSEVNIELIDEMKQELESGNTDEALNVADDIRENNVKITEHGKRADAIVKGMLQHSRTSTGQREPTDINTLADEYLRLSYHGFRAKDKDFNAILKTDFDTSIGIINIIPQDVGRALLNLFNNAFYAINEKNISKKSAGEPYEPILSVSTKKVNDKVEISVKDNGNGITQKIVDKIFQPFFTTKPTGQGTGLGLSLSYDIIKTHGGELRVKTKEGEGTTFIILITAPI